MNLVTNLTGFLALDWRRCSAEIFINRIRFPMSSVLTDSIKVNVFQTSMLPLLNLNQVATPFDKRTVISSFLVLALPILHDAYAFITANQIINVEL